jgi:hypothetical protein
MARNMAGIKIISRRKLVFLIGLLGMDKIVGIFYGI